MTIDLPDQITENSLDDIQSIDFNIDTLYNRFIVPIEQMRSMSAPLILEVPRGTDANGLATQRELDSAAIDNTTAQESRTHAFYRMIGLPVIDQDGNIYNPGFNPRRTEKARIQNNAIADRIEQPIRLMSRLREQNTRNRLAIFQRGGQHASIYALVLPILKKFQIIDDNKDFNIQDDQKFTLPRRKLFITTNFQNVDGSDLTQFFDSGNHMLRPFVVDPAIERTVMPSSRLVCEPFLANLLDTRLELDILLQRPTIEYVLRSRLSESNTEISALDETVFALDPTTDTEGLSLPDLRRVAFALLDDNKIADQDLLERIGATHLELIVINNLIRAIKAAIDIMIEAVETISDVAKNIDWLPLPVVLGPEFGSDVANLIAKKTRSSELEKRIKQLLLKAQNSTRQITSAPATLGTYALSSFDNMEKLFADELATVKEQKMEFIRRGSDSLRTIEIVSGEISGLGLIDILSVYTALWSVDLEVLLGLLDSNAFQRLYDSNPSLRNTDVVQRNQSGPTISAFTALQKFEQQVINILAFSDRLLEQKLASPKLTEGGSI